MRTSSIELALRQALHARGLRFRVQYRFAPGTPDVAFPTQRLAVFVDGEFWHRFILERTPKAWRRAIDANHRRAAAVNRQLEELGWRVLRLRERDVRSNLSACVEAVTRAARQNA